jgi:hypothetical protein
MGQDCRYAQLRYCKGRNLDIQPDGNIVGKPYTRKARLDVIEKRRPARTGSVFNRGVGFNHDHPSGKIRRAANVRAIDYYK